MKWVRITSQGYKWDSSIPLFAMLLVAAFAIAIMAKHDFNFGLRPYVECPGPVNCINPLYWAKEGKICADEKGFQCVDNPDLKKVVCSSPWCKQVWLRPGTYGTPPDPLFTVYMWFTIIVFLLTIPVNHFVHNRGKKFHLGLTEYYEDQIPWLLRWIRKLNDKLEDE